MIFNSFKDLPFLSHPSCENIAIKLYTPVIQSIQWYLSKKTYPKWKFQFSLTFFIPYKNVMRIINNGAVLWTLRMKYKARIFLAGLCVILCMWTHQGFGLELSSCLEFMTLFHRKENILLWDQEGCFSLGLIYWSNRLDYFHTGRWSGQSSASRAGLNSQGG